MTPTDQNLSQTWIERIPTGSDCFMSRTSLKSGKATRLHTHDCVEMVYVTSGSGETVFVFPDGSSETMPLTAGDYYFMDYRVWHYYQNGTPDFSFINFLWHPTLLKMSGDTEKSFFAIMQNAPLYVDRSMLTSSPVQRAFHDVDRSIAPFFTGALKNYREQPYGYYEILRCCCTQVLLQTFQHMVTGRSYVQKSRIISEICDYIAVNYPQRLTLTEICRQKNFSLPYISQKFKDTCGITFEQYLSNVRIQKACDLLLKSDDPVGEIAVAVGYNTPAAFRRLFLRIVGMLPLEYRKAHGKIGK